MQFGVIVADMPWNFGDTGRKSLVKAGQQGSTVPHYTSMIDDEIVALPVGALAREGTVLLMWAPWGKIETAVRCINAYGFTLVSGFPWVKVEDIEGEPLRPVYGTGYYARGVSEPLLIARYGDKAPPRNPYAGLISERFEHSRKPDNVHQYAEGFPGPYIELFARGRRAGWVTLGDHLDGLDIRESIRNLG